MANADSNQPPVVSRNPKEELRVLLEKSIQLQQEALTTSTRIRELHEQIAQQSNMQSD
jgi:hypothetical protein